jgi:hypothetical protein
MKKVATNSIRTIKDRIPMRSTTFAYPEVIWEFRHARPSYAELAKMDDSIYYKFK